MIYSEEDRKFNRDITIGLIRSELLNLAEYNVHMAKLLDAGRNSTYGKLFVQCDELEILIQFTVSILQRLQLNLRFLSYKLWLPMTLK